MRNDALSGIRGAEDASALHALVRGLDAAALSPRDVEVVTRALRRHPLEGIATRIAVLGNHTLDPLAARIPVHAAVTGMHASAWTGPFGQYVQAIMDASLGLGSYDPQVVFLSLAMRALAPDVHGAFASLDDARRASERDGILDHVDSWVTAALGSTEGLLLVANFPRPAESAFGPADSGQAPGEAEFYMELNLELLRRARSERRVRILDMDRLTAAHGYERAMDDRLFHLAKIPWTEAFTGRVADEILRFARASQGRARKCLVLDLDNTLWGGIAGEDGPAALQIGAGSAAGEAFADFQRALKGLQGRGVMLALCSKNNPADVDAVFRARPEMPLRREDFVAERVNWDPKPANLVAIAEELNIGTDALVFADDNPAERAIVRGALPEVAVLDLPSDPAAFADTLRRTTLFDRLDVTGDDRAKTEQYAQQSRRRQFERGTGDMGSYLAGLETELVVRPAGPEDLSRVHQLVTKTNQFNLTTRRYSPAELERFLADGRYDLTIARLRDRFGDMGVIAFYLVRREGDTADIETFLMSCRALGRGAETALMNRMKRRYATLVERLNATFIRTAKNTPAVDFLAGQGFILDGEEAGGIRRYHFRLRDGTEIPCAHIQVIEEVT
jgi:FkbH-like protein